MIACVKKLVLLSSLKEMWLCRKGLLIFGGKSGDGHAWPVFHEFIDFTSKKVYLFSGGAGMRGHAWPRMSPDRSFGVFLFFFCISAVLEIFCRFLVIFCILLRLLFNFW